MKPLKCEGVENGNILAMMSNCHQSQPSVNYLNPKLLVWRIVSAAFSPGLSHSKGLGANWHICFWTETVFAGFPQLFSAFVFQSPAVLWGKWLLLQKRFCERFPPNFGSPNFLNIGFSVSAFLWCIWPVSEQFSGQFYQLCCNYICIFFWELTLFKKKQYIYTPPLYRTRSIMLLLLWYSLSLFSEYLFSSP